jgi:hypothetical protein
MYVEGVWLEDSAIAELALILYRARHHDLSKLLGVAVDDVWDRLELSQQERVELLPFVPTDARYAALREALVEQGASAPDPSRPRATRRR